MRRSGDFGATIRYGERAVQPDIVIHVRRDDDPVATPGPRVGLIVAKSVGDAVRRHRVARRLRHVARELLGELDPADRLVIRALPTSGGASSAELSRQLRAGLRRVHRADRAGSAAR